MDSTDVEKLIAEVFDHPIMYYQSLSAHKDKEREKCMEENCIIFGRQWYVG